MYYYQVWGRGGAQERAGNANGNWWGKFLILAGGMGHERIWGVYGVVPR